MKAVGISYMFPLVMLMIGVAIGYGIYDSLAIKLSQEIFSFLVGMVFISISYFIVNRIDKKHRESGKFKLAITKIL
jgi:sigma-E factor negative regulatory protein RseC